MTTSETDDWIRRDGSYYFDTLSDPVELARNRRKEPRAGVPMLGSAICIGFPKGSTPGMTTDQRARFICDIVRDGEDFVRIGLNDVRSNTSGRRVNLDSLAFFDRDIVGADRPVDGFYSIISQSGSMALRAEVEGVLEPMVEATEKDAHDFITLCRLGLSPY